MSIALTPEQKKEADEKKLNAFLTDVSNVEKNHNLKLVAVIDRTPTGSQARIITIPLKEFEAATK